MTAIARRRVLELIGRGIASVSVGTGITAAQDGQRPDGSLRRQVAGVRAATAPFKDPANAESAGYAPITPFVCGMGTHWGSEAETTRLLGGGLVDPLVPPVINYGEDKNGNLVLGAVEYFAPTERFDADGNVVVHYEEPPDLFADDRSGLLHQEEWEVLPMATSGLPVDVWALHVWVHRRNPNGVFAHTNSRPLFNKDGCVPLGEEE